MFKNTMLQTNQVMNKNYVICTLFILSACIGILTGAALFSTNTITERVIEIDNNPDLELRLQAEIDSNQELAEMVTDVLNACNEKLLDKYESTNEKLKKENEILQKALSEYRAT